MNIVTGLLTSLAENAGKEAAPFALGEIAALAKFGADFAKAELDFSDSPEEREFIKNAAIANLKTFVIACEDKGIEILTDLPSIFLSAGADDLMKAFDFTKPPV